MIDEHIKELIRHAISAREYSYSPYSNYMVGAALLCGKGEIITGCNIENAAYSPTNCAERTAFFKAISIGKRDFVAIAIVGGKKGAEQLDMAYPCGVCRQVMKEFCNEQKFRIIVAKSEDEYEVHLLKDVFPKGFGPGNLA